MEITKIRYEFWVTDQFHLLSFANVSMFWVTEVFFFSGILEKKAKTNSTNKDHMVLQGISELNRTELDSMFGYVCS